MWFERESAALERKIIEILDIKNGLTDQEISEKISLAPSSVRALCGQLAFKNKIERKRIKDGPLKNYLKIKAIK